jgi:hypothetical protein
MNLLTRVNTIMDRYQIADKPVICNCGADLRAIPFIELQTHDSHELNLPACDMPEWFRAEMIAKLNRIADYCSEQCLIQSTKDFDACREWAQACLIVQDVTDLMMEGK